MKKVFMSVAVVALMVAASACGNNAKKAEAVEAETEVEAVEETPACCGDSTSCCDSTKACCDSVKAE